MAYPSTAYTNSANTTASAITLKNGSRTALIGSALQREAANAGQGRLSIGGLAASQTENSEQGSAFISPIRLKNILLTNTPPGTPPPPLPLPPPPLPFPSKAFFSPVGISTTVGLATYTFGNQVSVSSILQACNYSFSLIAPTAVYAQTYNIYATDNLSNTISTSYQFLQQQQQIQMSLEVSTPLYAIAAIQAANYYGSTTYKIPIPFPPVPVPLTEGIVSCNTTYTTINYDIQNIQDTRTITLGVTDINLSTITSFNGSTSNNTLFVNLSNLAPASNYITTIFASNYFALTTLSFTQTTVSPYGTILNYTNYMAQNPNNNFTVGTVTTATPIPIAGQTFGFEYYLNQAPNYLLYNSNQINYFTNTADSNSSWIIFTGNVTINTNITLTPPVRKLFTVLYVGGNLTLNGTMSMTARGAKNIPGSNIQIGVNTHISATGASGAASNSSQGATAGGNGSGSQTGGGGGGYLNKAPSGSSSVGAGGAGTSFSGGSASGANNEQNIGSLNGGSNGGAGSAGVGANAGGGAGNPGGTPNGTSGTGGTLIVIVQGTLSGTGSFTSQGSAGGGGGGLVYGGGGSGGGNVTVLYGTLNGTHPSINVTGGAGGIGSGDTGGAGGAGGSRLLAISAS